MENISNSPMSTNQIPKLSQLNEKEVETKFRTQLAFLQNESSVNENDKSPSIFIKKSAFNEKMQAFEEFETKIEEFQAKMQTVESFFMKIDEFLQHNQLLQEKGIDNIIGQIVESAVDTVDKSSKMVSQQQFISLKEMVTQQGNRTEDIMKQLELHDHRFSLYTTKIKTEDIEKELNEAKLEISKVNSLIKSEYLTETTINSLLSSSAKHCKDTYITYQLFNEHLEANKMNLSKIYEKHQAIDFMLAQHKDVMKTLKLELQPKISFTDFESESGIKINTLKTRCSYDDLNELKKIAIPSINEFRNEIELHKQLIQSFDEVLTEKASKFSVGEIQDKLRLLEQLGNEYRTLKNNLQQKVENTEKLTTSMDNTIKELNKSITLEIKNSVRKNIDQLKTEFKSKGDECKTDNKKINRVIEEKADKTEVLSLLNTKSNVKDTDANMKAIDIMHKQIKHLSVIMVEILRFETEKYNKHSKTLNQSKNHSECLLNQCMSIAKWINKFNPENINTYDLVLPKELWRFRALVNSTLNDFLDDKIDEEMNGLNEVIKKSSSRLNNNHPSHNAVNNNSDSKNSQMEKYCSNKRNHKITNLKHDSSFIQNALKTDIKFSEGKIKLSNRLNKNLKFAMNDRTYNEISISPTQDKIDQIKIGFRSPKARLKDDSTLYPTIQYPTSHLSRQTLHQQIRSLERDMNLP